MDEIIEFVRKFLKAEYELRVAALTDAKGTKRDKKLEAALAFCAPGPRRIVNIPNSVGAYERKEAKNSIVRPLFMVREFQKGKLYQAIAGGGQNPDFGSSFEWALFIDPKEDGPKIISIYRTCVVCVATGKVKGKTCGECDGNTVSVKSTGEAIDLKSKGKPTAVEKIEAPEAARWRSTYDAY